MKTLLLAFSILIPLLTIKAEGQPNIIFLEVDDLMPRFMNKLGRGFGITPNLDRLASEGVHFKNAVCQAPMCGPSRNSLVTNLYPHNLGFYRNGHMKTLPEDIWTFPGEFKKVGYQTAYIGKSHLKPFGKKGKKGPSKSDLHKSFFGFDFANCTGERYAMWSSLKKKKSIDDIPFIQYLKAKGKYEQFVKDNSGNQKVKSSMEDDFDYLDGYITKVCLDYIKTDRNKEKPFFMWLNYCLPHGPYDVPQRYHDRVASLEIPGPLTTSFGHEVPKPLLKDNKPPKKPDSVSEARRGEAANVLFLDTMIGHILQQLENESILEDTVIIFFSDHSIFMGNHGRTHKGSLFEENLNTSMIVRYPKEFRQDYVSAHPVELLDLVPTAFDIAGIQNPESVAKNGFSIVPLLKGEKSNGRKYAFSEILGAQAATSERYRYITSEGVDILYDLVNDPIEMNNIAGEFPEVTAQYKAAVKYWLENTGPIREPNTF